MSSSLRTLPLMTNKNPFPRKALFAGPGKVQASFFSTNLNFKRVGQTLTRVGTHSTRSEAACRPAQSSIRSCSTAPRHCCSSYVHLFILCKEIVHFHFICSILSRLFTKLSIISRKTLFVFGPERPDIRNEVTKFESKPDCNCYAIYF